MADKKPAIAPELVREFVACAHGDFNPVKELLGSEPALINAFWDWGGGNWETGLGAAAHVGHREIAIYLLDRGARNDLFAAAMLGKFDIDSPDEPHMHAVSIAFDGSEEMSQTWSMYDQGKKTMSHTMTYRRVR